MLKKLMGKKEEERNKEKGLLVKSTVCLQEAR